MMNFSRNSLPTTPAAATPGSQANTPFGNAVLLDGNMITPLIALPQKQQLPAAAISNSVVDFQRAFQNVMPTTPTQNNNVGQSAEELFRWWISQQAASGALIVGTSTNTPVTQNQTPTTVAAISPMVSNTNVVTVGMSPRANGISPRTNMPAMQSPILHSPVAMNQGQGISPRSISAMSPRNSMSNMNSPSVTNMHSPLSAMNMMAMASGSNQLKSLQAQQQQAQQQVQQKPSQSPVKQMPNLSIGGLTPFVNAFNKFYDIFNCDLVDPIGNIVRKDEFPKTCLKEIFTDSKISEALMRRGYQLTPEDYQTLDYVLKINCFDECFAIFLRIYFKNINEVLINIDGEQRVIQYYKNIWKSYLMGSVVLETMYGGGNQEAANMGTLMDQKSLHGGNLAGKVLLALKKWKEFFFNEKEDPYVCIPLAVRKLIEREFSGDGNHTELISPEILNSYKILGIYPTKSTRLSDHPSPLEWFEFVRWHLIKFPVLPEPSNLTPKKPESMNMMVQPPPQMLRPSELSRSSELSRHEISFHENQSAVDPDEYVEVVATPRPSPKPYTRKLERMRPPFMAPMNFINAANRSNSQPLFVQPQLPSQQNGTLNQHNTTNNNTPITPVNTTISLPMISSYLMQHNGTGMPLLPFRMPTLPHRTQSQHALLPSNNSMNQNGSIMSQTMEQNEGYNSCDDVSIINDKKAIRRIKNNEASRRYRARMREKRKEWAEKLRERDDSISKSPENPTVTRDSTCQTSDMLLKNESPIENKLSEFSISLFSRESRESSLESFEPEIAERIVKKQLYKISRREKNNIAVRKYRHKRKQRIEMNKKELVYLSNRHIELLKSIEMLKKQMSVLLAFEGITDNELLRAQVGKLENASAIAKNRFIDPQNLLETPSFLMYSEPDTIIIEESD